MLRPRPLPPAHKNQLHVPVKTLGHPDTIPAFFRHQKVTRKRFEPKPPAAVAALGGGLSASPTSPRDPKQHHHPPSSPHPFLTSSTDSVTSLIHVRGRASVSDVTLSLEGTSRKTPRTNTDREEQVEEEEVGVGGGSSFLTEDPESSRSFGHRSSVFSPALECSKYTVIGEPRFRKKRIRRSEWTMPRIGEDMQQQQQQQKQQQQQQQGGRVGRLERIGHLNHPKTNSIDLVSIYSSRSKLLQVPPTAVKREDTVILSPLSIGRRREEAEASVDAQSLAEKRLVMRDHRSQGTYRRLVRDHVPRPAAYKPYFRSRHCQQRFARSLFGPDEVWESHPVPVSCARCPGHQQQQQCPNVLPHYCDVLGKRFCRVCSESTERAFARAYEGNRLLVPSPHRSPTLQMLREPSFLGVRKVVITKTVILAGQGQSQGS